MLCLRRENRLRTVEHGPTGRKRRENMMISEGARVIGPDVGNGDLVVDGLRIAQPPQSVSAPPCRLGVVICESQPAGSLLDVPLLSFFRAGDPDISFREAGRQIKQHDGRSLQLPVPSVSTRRKNVSTSEALMKVSPPYLESRMSHLGENLSSRAACLADNPCKGQLGAVCVPKTSSELMP